MAMNKTEAAAFKAMENARDMARALRWPTYAEPTPVDKDTIYSLAQHREHGGRKALQGWSASTYRDEGRAYKVWSTGTACTSDPNSQSWSQGPGVIYLTQREALQAVRFAKTIEYAADLARLDALIAALDDGAA